MPARKTVRPVDAKTLVPPSEEMIYKLIVLEERVAGQPPQSRDLDSLTDIYVKLIEFYDSQSHPIKLYFIEKVQSLIFASTLPRREAAVKSFEERLGRCSELTTRTAHASDKLVYEQIKRSRGNEFASLDKISRACFEAAPRMSDVCEKFFTVSRKNALLVQSQLNAQQASLVEKITARKQISLQSSFKKSQESSSCHLTERSRMQRSTKNFNFLLRIQRNYSFSVQSC